MWRSSQSQTGQEIRALFSYSTQNILYRVSQGTLVPLEWTSACCSRETSCLGCLGWLALPYMDLCSRSERVACKSIKALASAMWKPNLTKGGGERAKMLPELLHQDHTAVRERPLVQVPLGRRFCSVAVPRGRTPAPLPHSQGPRLQGAS